MIRAGCLLIAMLLATSGRAETQYVEGDVIVTFKATASLNTAKATLKKRSMAFSRHFGALSAKRKKQTGLVSDASKTTAQLIAELKKEPDVETVEPNYLRWVKAKPNDTRFSELWALENTGQTVNGTAGTAGADIKFLPAWERARTSTTKLVVAVIDTGVDYTHPDLAANMWINDEEIPGNSTDDDSDGYADDVHGYDFSANDAAPWDSGHHGTHVAGTIAGLGNNQDGITGVNDHVKIMALKVSNNGNTISTSAVIAAVQYATMMKTRGVNVVAINASYGGGGFSTAERDAIVAAGDAGIILCAAAGNETANNDNIDSYPASYRLANMIVVAATDQKDALASYSNFGATTVDMAAPGSDILSLKPSTMIFKAGGTTYTTNELDFTGRTTSVTGTIIDCGIGSAGQFPAAVSGNIALIQRGDINFSVKVQNAMNAGAKAAIIYNNIADNFLGTLQTSGNWIPALSISQADGLAIKAALPLAGSVTASSAYQFLDGTSMATPHVAGAVAFAAMCFSSETVAQRRQRILEAVDSKSSLQGKVITGGRLNLLSVINGGALGLQPWPYITSDPALNGGAVGEAYAAQVSATGGTEPYTFSLTQGSLPAGITLSEDGLISGTPTAVGSNTFTLLASDLNGPGTSRQFTLVTTAPLSITSVATLPTGAEAVDYLVSLAVSGGTGPYAWAIIGGSLPAGLSLSSNGMVSGLPTEAGTSNFTAEVTDTLNVKTSQVFQVTIEDSPITINHPTSLPGGVKGVAYSQVLSASGGTAPYTWTLAAGTLPAGISLSASGVLIGIPSAVGSSSFTLEVTDDDGLVGAKSSSIEVTATFQVPVMNIPTFGTTTVGASWAANVSAANYPKTFIISGLPKGVSYHASTGAISGRALASGVFNVQIRARNTAGTSAAVIAPLVVKALPTGMVGSFTGLIARDATANGGLGSRLTLTTTTIGGFTAKVMTGGTTKSATGYLAATAPQIQVLVAGSLLSLTLDGQTSLLGGTHGAAMVQGWRQTWHSTNHPAASHAGYYSVGLDLADAGDDGIEGIPQGSGYAAFTIATGGTITVAGKTADGQAMTSAGFMGPSGQIAIYQSLYGSKGTIAGAVTVGLDPDDAFLENTATGTLTWQKPATTARAYKSAFGPLNLSATGKYLAPSAKGHVVLGLPNPGNAALNFLDGGLSLAKTDPNINEFSYSSTNVVTLPAAGSGDNPARATLSINKATGAFTGTFTLVEPSPLLSRKVTYYGMIVRPTTGTAKGAGWFLLPQIPINDENSKNSPVLSGKVVIDQP